METFRSAKSFIKIQLIFMASRSRAHRIEAFSVLITSALGLPESWMNYFRYLCAHCKQHFVATTVENIRLQFIVGGGAQIVFERRENRWTKHLQLCCLTSVSVNIMWLHSTLHYYVCQHYSHADEKKKFRKNSTVTKIPAIKKTRRKWNRVHLRVSKCTAHVTRYNDVE